MSGLILCTKKSEIPFRIADSDMNIYSIEELAYYLYNNAYFVDESFFTEELTDYIENKLKLVKVAKRLKYASGQRLDFTERVMIILTGSMYYTENELKAFEKELKSISSKSMLERMSARAKMLYDNGRLASAKHVYENILNNTNYNKQDEKFYAEVHCGIASVYCRMFYFKEAIEELNKAYKLDHSEEILKSMINAKLMAEKSDGVKADFTKENEINKGLVFQCMEDFKALEEKIRMSEGYEQISKVFTYDGKHNLDDYYENMQITLDEWKEEYRNDIL